MSVVETSTVDFMSIDPASGCVVLTVSDHLEWQDHDHDHALLLQEKLNTYLKFVESGELTSRNPDYRGRAVKFSIALKHRPNEYAEKFLSHARKIVADAGIELDWEVKEYN